MPKVKLDSMFVFRVLTAMTTLGTLIACEFMGRMGKVSNQLLTFTTGAITYSIMEISPELKELKNSTQNALLPLVKGILIYSIVATICVCEFIGSPASPFFFGLLGVVGAFLYG